MQTHTDTSTIQQNMLLNTGINTTDMKPGYCWQSHSYCTVWYSHAAYWWWLFKIWKFWQFACSHVLTASMSIIQEYRNLRGQVQC